MRRCEPRRSRRVSVDVVAVFVLRKSPPVADWRVGGLRGDGGNANLLLSSEDPLMGYSHNDEDGAGEYFIEKNSGGGKTLGRRGEGDLPTPPFLPPATAAYGVDDAETKLDVERDSDERSSMSTDRRRSSRVCDGVGGCRRLLPAE